METKNTFVVTAITSLLQSKNNSTSKTLDIPYALFVEENFPLASVSTLHSLSLCFQKETSFYQGSHYRPFVEEKSFSKFAAACFKRFRFSSQIILLALILYFENACSLRKIKRFLLQQYHISVSHVSIWRWFNHFAAFFVPLPIFCYRMRISNRMNGMQMKLSFGFREYSITFGFYWILKPEL